MAGLGTEEKISAAHARAEYGSPSTPGRSLIRALLAETHAPARGAGTWGSFRYVTLPALLSAIFIVTTHGLPQATPSARGSTPS